MHLYPVVIAVLFLFSSGCSSNSNNAIKQNENCSSIKAVRVKYFEPKDSTLVVNLCNGSNDTKCNGTLAKLQPEKGIIYKDNMVIEATSRRCFVVNGNAEIQIDNKSTIIPKLEIY